MGVLIRLLLPAKGQYVFCSPFALTVSVDDVSEEDGDSAMAVVGGDDELS